MTTLVDYINELKKSIAMDDDDSVSLMKRGVNAGLITAALLYEPPELRTSSTLNTAVDGTPINLSSELTRYVRLEEVYNYTRTQRVWPLDFSHWEIFKLPDSGYITYYTIYGDNLYYKPYPSIIEALTLFYFQYPARVSSDGDTVPLDMYQDFIISVATMYVWASKEEMEDVDIWQKITSGLHLPFEKVAKARGILRKEVSSGNNLQGALPASSP